MSAPNIEGTSNPTATGGNVMGVVVGNAATETLGFYGSTGVVQPVSGTGTTAGFTAVNTSTAVAAASTFTGNTGSSAYTITDLVYALKKLGLIAA